MQLDDPQLCDILQKMIVKIFQQKKSVLCGNDRENILKIQREAYNKKQKPAVKYRVRDVVAIQRTQSNPGLKVHSKFLGSYKIATALRNDRYVVEKIGECEGPRRTNTSADHLPWSKQLWESNVNVLMEDDDDDVIDILSIENDNNIRMAECGIGGANTILGSEEREREKSGGELEKRQ